MRNAVFIVLVAILSLAASMVSQKINDVNYIKQLNKMNKKWVAGHNSRFGDMTVDEFRKRFLGTVIEKSAEERFGGMYTEAEKKAMMKSSNNSVPTSFDSRQQWPNCIHPIRDQAHCGSCWAFSGSEVLSDRFCIASNGKVNVVLSPQDMVSCDSYDSGCNGGMLTNLWTYLQQTGIVPDTCFPYASQQGDAPECPAQCTDGSGKSLNSLKYKAKNYYHVGGASIFSSRVEKIQTELMTNGPIQVAFSVYRDFISYKSGVYHHTSGAMLGGHAVKLVGWGVDTDGTPFWNIANSWNTTWGEQGFFRILRGKDECGIESQAYTGMPDTTHVPSLTKLRL